MQEPLLWQPAGVAPATAVPLPQPPPDEQLPHPIFFLYIY
ncbi:hypothetical protein HMPREF0765_3485 [Sphingobacterium spiritivorum ATCC 33300]|uniref:Uncharacterized protein n=1 Tax=Sphingobacterium spiritivorum ATCC 33300 TaxID=525372 RepID=C2G1M9_SPHSI|nr:hypothetical protein HMPREF0765_3485 [Sphingobacterium spiritivorum ATCC 33300]